MAEPQEIGRPMTAASTYEIVKWKIPADVKVCLFWTYKPAGMTESWSYRFCPLCHGDQRGPWDVF